MNPNSQKLEGQRTYYKGYKTICDRHNNKDKVKFLSQN